MVKKEQDIEHTYEQLNFERIWSSRQDSEGYKTLKDSDSEDLDYKATKLLKDLDSKDHVIIRRLWSVLSSFE